MAEPEALSAVEAFVLLEPQRARGAAAVKLAMLTLLAQGDVAVASERSTGFSVTAAPRLCCGPRPGRGEGFPARRRC
jgi:hypothetical protein